MTWITNKPRATVPATAATMLTSSSKPGPPRWTAAAVDVWAHSQLTAESATLPKSWAIGAEGVAGHGLGDIRRTAGRIPRRAAHWSPPASRRRRCVPYPSCQRALPTINCRPKGVAAGRPAGPDRVSTPDTSTSVMRTSAGCQPAAISCDQAGSTWTRRPLTVWRTPARAAVAPGRRRRPPAWVGHRTAPAPAARCTAPCPPPWPGCPGSAPGASCACSQAGQRRSRLAGEVDIQQAGDKLGRPSPRAWPHASAGQPPATAGAGTASDSARIIPA